jgi:hypothetical protein
MKDLLANIIAALLAGAVGIGYVVAGVARAKSQALP